MRFKEKKKTGDRIISVNKPIIISKIAKFPSLELDQTYSGIRN